MEAGARLDPHEINSPLGAGGEEDMNGTETARVRSGQGLFGTEDDLR